MYKDTIWQAGICLKKTEPLKIHTFKKLVPGISENCQGYQNGWWMSKETQV